MDGDRRDEDDRPDDDRRDESPSEALLRAARERLQDRAETDDGAELAAWYESAARTLDEGQDDPAHQDVSAAAAAAADASWSSPTEAPAPRAPAPPQWEQDDEPFWKDENDVDDDRTVYSPGHHPTESSDGGPLVTRRRSGLRMVVAFLVLVGLAIAAVALLAAVDGSETSDAIEPFATGECLSLPDSNLITRDDVVPCDEPHEFEVTGAAVLDFDTYPTDGDFGDSGAALCQPLFAGYVGTSIEGPWYSHPLYPSQEAWENGDRGISCTVVQVTDDGDWLAVTGSARGAG